MKIDTYFGFFAEAVMHAITTSLTDLTGQAVNLDTVHLSNTNTIKLRFSDVETVMRPVLAAKVEVGFLFALNERDIQALTKLAEGRMPFHKMMEQVISTAAEPFNFITKRRNRLTGLEVSRNVTGFTAHHLDGEVSYTMATGTFLVRKGQGFSLRILVTAAGRDLIEDRTIQPSTQRALFSINQGAYICRPQWEPPPPPPGLDQGASLSEVMMNAWLQTFFGLNDNPMGNRLFQQPAGLRCALGDEEPLIAMAIKDGPPTVVRMHLDGQKAMELFVVLPAKVASNMMQLSKSGEERFLGDIFRALYGESAKLWSEFAQTPAQWQLQVVRKIPIDAIEMVTKRLEGGGLMARQTAHLDEGFLEWMLAVPPHTWHWLMRLTAKGMAHRSEGLPNRQAIFQATGWGTGRVPWPRMFGFFSDPDLQNLVRALTQARIEAPGLKAIGDTLDAPFRERWIEATPMGMRDRIAGYEMAQGEAGRRLKEVAEALVPLNRAGKLPGTRFRLWVSLYTEFLFSRRDFLIDQLLPLRHMIYGLDRASLSRLLFDAKGETLSDMLSCAEFPVLDQVRRAISPGFTLRLFDEIGLKRKKTTPFAAQEAQLDFYRLAFQGATRGRYMVRATPSNRLRELIRLIDEED